MSSTRLSKDKRFQNVSEAASHAFSLINKQMELSALFMLRNDGEARKVIKIRNQGDERITEDFIMSLDKAFCNWNFGDDEAAVVAQDIAADERAGSLNTVVKGSFVSIPVYGANGKVYGTIGGYDSEGFAFQEHHIAVFEMMASLLTSEVELAKANEQIESLSSPLVPVLKGVSILPIIGEITAKRAQLILDQVLHKCGEKGVEYLIIDVSGVSRVNTQVGSYLLNLVNLMKLVGVTPVITGIQPFMALKVPHFARELKGIMIESNLEAALKKLGFVLLKDCQEKPVRF